METPYKGRAVINEDFNTLTIKIPSRKNWFVIFFLSFWLAGWLFGFVAVGSTILTGLITSEAPGFFTFFPFIWITLWTVAGLFAFRKWLWLLVGKEIITFERGTINLRRAYALFHRSKTYDLNEIVHFGVNNTHRQNDFSFFTQNRNSFNLTESGAFSFDYGHRTILFGEGIDAAEARIILQKLQSKKIIKDANTLQG